MYNKSPPNNAVQSNKRTKGKKKTHKICFLCSLYLHPSSHTFSSSVWFYHARMLVSRENMKNSKNKKERKRGDSKNMSKEATEERRVERGKSMIRGDRKRGHKWDKWCETKKGRLRMRVKNQSREMLMWAQWYMSKKIGLTGKKDRGQQEKTVPAIEKDYVEPINYHELNHCCMQRATQVFYSLSKQWPPLKYYTLQFYLHAFNPVLTYTLTLPFLCYYHLFL